MEILVILSSTFAKNIHCKLSHMTTLHVAQQDMVRRGELSCRVPKGRKRFSKEYLEATQYTRMLASQLNNGSKKFTEKGE